MRTELTYLIEMNVNMHLLTWSHEGMFSATSANANAKYRSPNYERKPCTYVCGGQHIKYRVAFSMSKDSGDI